MADVIPNSAEMSVAFAEYDRRVILNNIKVGCVVGAVLMPVGVLLDVCVYPEEVWTFLCLRLLCSALIGAFWALVVKPLGARHSKGLGIILAMFPTFFISLMIFLKDGAASPYYAGLNLVLLVIGFVLYWTFFESLVAFTLVLMLYLAACFLHPGGLSQRDLRNNLYFLVLTGVIVMTGSYYHTKYRYREFALRFELDRNRRQLEENNQKLRELDEIKSRFFANISHELRTPLTLLIAPLETLMSRYHLDRETKELLGTMHSNGMRLLKLINDLIDLVRLESGRITARPRAVHLKDFLGGLASAARQVADDKRLRLETRIDQAIHLVMVDTDKLEKIILNLVFNALKFTPAGGRVEVSAEKQGETLVIAVSDTGMGIAEKNLPFIFDRFWQADSASNRKYQGVGIGLALVKELVEVQKGTVTVESKLGAGTTFTVRLPYEAAEAPDLREPTPLPAADRGKTEVSPEPSTAEEPADRTVSSEEWLANLYRRAELFPALTPVQESLRPLELSSSGNKPTVLVADDEPDMLRFLKSQLSREYQVLEAVDGLQAVEKATQFLPDLIVLDMMMPEKDGLEACREIREHTSTESIPVVLLTARADEETKLQALSAGASDFLAKPFSTTELHIRIRNLVESHAYQRKVSKQKRALESTIDQLKETEMQLVQSEKVASLGRLSAGIIHEINNPLNFATTGLFTLRKKAQFMVPEHQEEYCEILKDVEDGINRVRNIVSDLRLFTHPEGETRDNVEVEKMVAAALRFFGNELKDRVEVRQQYAHGQTIWGNHNRLMQVLVNLLQNSLDAFRHKQFTGERPTIWIDGRVANGKSILLVRDNGSGIEHKHLDKIFDPFYTTKEIGQGMGLGLSICYRIVQELGGRITVHTETGKYTEFGLEFPVKTASEERAPGRLVA